MDRKNKWISKDGLQMTQKSDAFVANGGFEIRGLTVA